jgi:pimeloyl-ACP methyl ester carboxylesterase
MEKSVMSSRKFVLLLSFSLLFSVGTLSAQDLFFDSASIKIHYTLQGKGEPVLLIHGLTRDITSMDAVAKSLSDSFSVISMDVRGHGQSGKPHEPGAYGIQIVEDCVRLLDHLKIDKAHAVGYSLGGRIVCSLLGRHPERLRTAVIGGFGWHPPEDPEWKAYEEEIAKSLEQGKGIEPLLKRYNPGGSQALSPEFMEAINKSVIEHNDSTAIAALVRNHAPFPSKEKLQENKIPSLALIGELDPNKSDVDRLKEIMPGIKVVVIPDANHVSAMFSPVLIRNIRSFLLEHASPAP